MEHYSRPGNMRELRNTMERMMVESKNNLIDPKAFQKGDDAADSAELNT